MALARSLVIPQAALFALALTNMARPPGPNKRAEMDLRWQDKAVCATAIWDDAFPEDYIDPAEDPLGFAKEVAKFRRSYCNRCPVNQQCFEHSMREREAGGIWAGVDLIERQLFLKHSLAWQGHPPEELRRQLRRILKASE